VAECLPLRVKSLVQNSLPPRVFENSLQLPIHPAEKGYPTPFRAGEGDGGEKEE